MVGIRIIYRGYAIEIRPVGSAYTVAIEPVRSELSIFGRRITDGFVREEEAVESAKARLDTILKS